ncbi:protein of unknown function (plasmid) [Caballeronia sp. S22]
MGLSKRAIRKNSYALAAELDGGERNIWRVMAAYQEMTGLLAAKTRTVPGFCDGARMNFWMCS